MVVIAALLASAGPAVVPVIGLVRVSDVVAPGAARVSADTDAALGDGALPRGRIGLPSERTWVVGAPDATRNRSNPRTSAQTSGAVAAAVSAPSRVTSV